MKFDRTIWLVIPSLNTPGGVEDLSRRLCKIWSGHNQLKIFTVEPVGGDEFFSMSASIVNLGVPGPKIFNFLYVCMRLCFLKYKFRPDVVISILPKSDLINCVSSFLQSGRIWSLYVINIRNNLDNYRIHKYKLFYGFFFRRFDKIFCIDDYLESEIVELFDVCSTRITRFKILLRMLILKLIYRLLGIGINS